MPAPKNPNKRTIMLTLPLTQEEMDEVESIARVWGRTKTSFARDLLLTSMRDLPPPEKQQPLPKAG